MFHAALLTAGAAASAASASSTAVLAAAATAAAVATATAAAAAAANHLFFLVSTPARGSTLYIEISFPYQQPASQPTSIQHPASSIQQPANQPTNQHPASSNQPTSQPTSHPTTSQPNPTQAVNPLGEGECFFIIFFLKNTPSRRDFFAFQKPRAFTYKMRVFFSPVFTFKMRFLVKNRRFVYAKWGGRKTAIVLPCVFDVFDGPKSESS